MTTEIAMSQFQSIREILNELVRHSEQRSDRRRRVKHGKPRSLQLALNFDPDDASQAFERLPISRERPLADIFPEAYS